MSSSTSIVENSSFKDAMRERILAACMDLIPREKVDELIDAEVQAFFTTEQLLTVQTTKVEVANPRYDNSKYGGYDNSRMVTRECLAFGSKMTPFRQLVWTVLHEYVYPIVKASLDEENSAAKIELDKFMIETATPQLNEGYKSLFSHLAVGMSAYMVNKAMQDAVTMSHFNLTSALAAVGMNINNLPPAVQPR